MADKNIQMKIKNGTNWDNLFPKTKASVTMMSGGNSVEDELSKKAKAADVYTKSEINSKLSGVVTDGNVYTKTEVDSQLATRAKIVVGATEDKTADFWFQEI
ncbi:hypothetical protein 10S11_39 [uncultured Caudovirales phage]|uniref:Uncharacterized protein n=1 Tax=uncultured Caudovirales phage TaxID=2100421 RepID=A0A2H4J894_9CAUD|nr:hypothetical protein 10S11_39 [uncultured Caudovirales phage]